MENPRFMAIRDALNHKPVLYSEVRFQIEKFGTLTFNRSVMERTLPKKVYERWLQAIEGTAKIDLEDAVTIAKVLKDWASGLGATHFCHWFQPQTGLAAEKHDSFIDWASSGNLIEKFSGSNLLRGEPDASSFPSGGLRETFQARGYTTWDPSSPPFLWQSGGTTILCIPAIFFSWKGHALDMKIPLLRSDAKINDAVLRLFHLMNLKAEYVYSTLGVEQEYFLVDRSLGTLRPDLLMTGRTVFGAFPPKGQELEDHYFRTVKERVLAYMKEMEDEAFLLGIPLKSRHNEVAPGQFEAAPIFESASIAVDHNIILMELMRQIATRHDMMCLLHEKPFQGINGSGKHNNWSLSTDTGMNLLDPKIGKENPLLFLMMLAAVLTAVNDNADLLRAAIASPGNDHRLGGHEAPPVIISVFLGQALEKVLDNVEKTGEHPEIAIEKFDVGLRSLPEMPKDNTDRNRTSPFAFTGNKFEFRAVGSSANCALPITVINVIVAQSLHQILDEIEKKLSSTSRVSQEAFHKAAMPVVRKYLKAGRRVCFSGNNYSAAWEKEAHKRKLPIIKKSPDAFEVFKNARVVKAFEGVLSKEELASRAHIMHEHYSKVLNIEARLMVDLFRTQIMPAAIEYQRKLAKSLKLLLETKSGKPEPQRHMLKQVSGLINLSIEAIDTLEKERAKAAAIENEVKKSLAFCDKVARQGHTARHSIDALEEMMDDRLWPLPKYRELLSIL